MSEGKDAPTAPRSAAPPAGEERDATPSELEAIACNLDDLGDALQDCARHDFADRARRQAGRLRTLAARPSDQMARVRAEVEALEPPMFNDESWLRGRDAALAVLDRSAKP